MQFNNPTRKIKNNMTTPHLKKSIGSSPLRRGVLLIVMMLASFTLSQMARAQLSPEPDGAYYGDNTAEGFDALYHLIVDTNNWTGVFDTAVGFQALYNNTTGFQNTANGAGALQYNTTGNSNTAIGAAALAFDTAGSSNIAVGSWAGSNLSSGDNNIDIGNAGVDGESNTMRIGDVNQINTYIAGISGVTVSGGAPVVVASDGHLGTADIPITHGSVVMLLVVNGQAPSPPTGYTLRGYTLLASKPNGGGQTTSYAVYAKN
jgi:hypothetical protein